jgi:hypothetical protein
MGSGSSSRSRLKVYPTTESDGHALQDRQRADDEARWLRSVIEKEKLEKEWLMARYERAERELMVRSEESANLRAQLAELRAIGGQVTAAPAPLETKRVPQDNLAKMTPIPGQANTPASSSQPVSPGTMSLKERRGLKLNVETMKASPKPPEDSAPIVLARTEDELRPTSSKAQLFLESLAQAPHSDMVEPMTAKPAVGRTSGSWLEEPMSPLLRRRLIEKGGGGPAGVKRKNVEKFKSSPGNMNLAVGTPKIFKMEDVPQTPKRIPATPATAKKRQDTIWSAPIVEELDSTP